MAVRNASLKMLEPTSARMLMIAIVMMNSMSVKPGAGRTARALMSIIRQHEGQGRDTAGGDGHSLANGGTWTTCPGVRVLRESDGRDRVAGRCSHAPA